MRVAPKSVLSSGWHGFVDHDWTIISLKRISSFGPFSACSRPFPVIPSHYEECFENIVALAAASSVRAAAALCPVALRLVPAASSPRLVFGSAILIYAARVSLNVIHRAIRGSPRLSK